MNPRAAVWSIPVLVALVAGCAQQAAPADPDDVAAAAAGWGIPADVVLTTAVDGFIPAPGGAGPYGSDGFSVVLTNPSDGAIMTLAATRGTMTAQSCPDAPFASTSGAAGGPADCTAEDGLFYRTTDGAAEYAAQRDDVLVQVSSDDLDRDALRNAAQHVRVPSQDDLAAMEPPSSADGGPDGSGTERGDLPPGDGAPDNGVGAGG